jgi:hypothetical protein
LIWIKANLETKKMIGEAWILNGMQLCIQEQKKPKLYVSWELKCGVEWNSGRNEREVGVQ